MTSPQCTFDFTSPSQEIPYGYCKCGCGQKTYVPTKNSFTIGYIKGVPIEFCKGHRRRMKALNSFWTQIKKGSPNECWPWTGRLDPNGYGYFMTRTAHRASWIFTNGPTNGLHVLHKCDVNYSAGDTSYRKCCNPNHLFLGTQSDNARDAASKKRHAHGIRHASAKVTEDDVREIRRLAATTSMSFKEIGKIFGITGDTVRPMVRRVTWKYVI